MQRRSYVGLWTIALAGVFCSYFLPVLLTNTQFSSRYECEETKEAESALLRAKSEECRTEIKNALCLSKKHFLSFPESTCPYYDSSTVNAYSGCFTDTPKNRVLQGALYKNVDAVDCQSFCHRPGFLYYTFNGTDCLCGNQIETSKIACNDAGSSCLKDSEESSGCLVVYRTGINGSLIQPRQTYVDPKTTYDDPVVILFLLQLNGRNDRQVKRLLKAIYSPKHLYVIHVDKRQQYMKKEMENLSSILPNLHVMNGSYSTIWGGASLLTMYLEAIKQTVAMKKFSNWDYLINLSESDFPILSMEELEAQLKRNKGSTYLASHNYNTAQFIVKQGFDHYFVECDEHMWRVGPRKELPKNIRIDGGSDWLVLHRDFAEYSISEEPLPRELRKLFASILLPLESFYHTLARNSHFCDTVISGNLKFTNWNRKQGCRCESLKKVVDWCGCSPLVLKSASNSTLSLENAINKSYYFARKFDSIMDIDAISFVENQVFRFRPTQINPEHPSYNSTYVNFYKRDIDGSAPHFDLLAENLLKPANSYKDIQMESIDIFRANSTSAPRMVFTIETPSNIVQLLVDRKNWVRIFANATVDGYILKAAQFGVNIDYKEEIFRDPLCYLTTSSVATVGLRWSRLHIAESERLKDKSSPHVKISWLNSNGVEVATQNVKAYNSIYGKQFSTLDLSSIDSRLTMPGIWKARVHSGTQTLAEVFFPVFSVSDQISHFRLAEAFFPVVDSCVDTDCNSHIWSTFYPDPKSEFVET